MTLERVINDFREFLLISFDIVSEFLSNDLLNDWLQTNWEIIVEARLQEARVIEGFIDVYGDGADCNGTSSRVSSPEKLPKYSVQIAPNVVFHSFGTLENDFFVQAQPFDYVKGEHPNGETFIVPFKTIKLSLGDAYDKIAI